MIRVYVFKQLSTMDIWLQFVSYEELLFLFILFLLLFQKEMEN